ncbi:condensation domain-containing protein [Tenacibaculum agarivorans]|uniref:condensation domain-containing protein n=1 Tax=Tenacibaculum agarivorans TaxID=1908389 RepID=UPI00094BA119|nr:condensation domain-containing protein [Tenacibaculum agarivorans]
MTFLRKENIQNIYPLSPIQEGMFFEAMLKQDMQAYIQQVTFDFHGHFDNEKFEQALQFLILRHDILRTVFTNKKEGQPLQIVLKQYPLDYIFYEEQLSSKMIEAENEKERKQIFDLFKGPLFKTRVYKKSDKVHMIAFTFHHILLDGWSLFKILEELILLYTDEKVHLPAPKSYREFIKDLSLKDERKAEIYWRTYLKNYEYPAQIPLKNEENISEFSRYSEEVLFNKEVSLSIQHYAKEYGITEYNLFIVVWGYLLTRFNNVDEAVFGVVNSGREAHLIDVVGITINTLPFRIKFPSNKTFFELIKDIQEDSTQNLEFIHTPLSKIQSFSHLKHQLFDHIFVYENLDWQDVNKERESINDTHISNIQNIEHTHYNFEVAVYPGKEIVVKFIYNSKKVDENFVAFIAKEFKTLLRTIITNPNLKIGELMTFLEEPVSLPVAIENF